MLRRGYVIALLMVVSVLLPLALMAEETASEEAKGETFGDWGKRCETPKEGGDEVCFIFQQLKVKENNQTILFVTMGIAPNGKGPVMVLTTPLGVALQAGMQLQVGEEGEPIRAAYNLCLTNGCRASLLLDEKLLEAMKGGEKLFVAFANAQGKGIKLAVSLKGFTDASNSLQ
ncbi:MAG: invasion associated locus B family protein [Sedimenticola sp.]|nr:invasion associated locus B family protein [Sedimenticola sp.]